MPPTLDDVVTLVRGATFAVTDAAGRIDPTRAQGVFCRDVRLLSRLRVTLDGAEPPLLSADRNDASGATQVHAAARGPSGSVTALLIRRRVVAATVRETYELRAFGVAMDEVVLCVELGADFAAINAFGHTVTAKPEVPLTVTPDGACLRAGRDGFAVEVAAAGDGLALADGTLRWRVRLSRGETWRGGVELRPLRDGEPVVGGRSGTAALRVTGERRWAGSVASALDDLQALRVEAAEHDLSYIGAGVPWYMGLFGRDTLIAGLEALVAGPGVALDVLRALARYQGSRHDERTLEQPGKILHELRTGGAAVFGLGAGSPYYGTVDATPLFVVLLAEAHRWGAPDADVRALLDNARAAVAWCAADGDLDGDGWVEYAPDTAGLVNQGWKDSPESTVHVDGSVARGPIALAQVEGYVYAALLALAELESRLGDAEAAAPLRERAADLRARFRRDFLLDGSGLVAMALDGDKRPLAVATSDIGHVLWSGVLDGADAAAAAGRLGAPDLTTRWGVRTLGSGEVAYNPLGYHVGSVWPHDSALVVAGVARAGDHALAARLTDGLLDACESFGWRLPELYAGLGADEVARPVPYPVACSPQAWSAGTPLLLLRAALGLEPDVPAGVVRLAPRLGDGVTLEVSGIDLGVAGALSVRVRAGELDILDAPAGLDVVVA